MIQLLRISMKFYRGKEFQPQEKELQAIIEKEVNETTSTNIGRLTIFKSPHFLRPFKCVVVMYVLLNLSGAFIITGYSASYFEGW